MQSELNNNPDSDFLAISSAAKAGDLKAIEQLGQIYLKEIQVDLKEVINCGKELTKSNNWSIYISSLLIKSDYLAVEHAFSELPYSVKIDYSLLEAPYFLSFLNFIESNLVDNNNISFCSKVIITSKSQFYKQILGFINDCSEELRIQLLLNIVNVLYENENISDISEIVNFSNSILSNMTSESTIKFFKRLPRPNNKKLHLIQQSTTQMLNKFSKLCEENNITYYLAFGSLLGAIRHDGWIPWDDDTDLIMADEEIEKLKNVLKDNDEFYLKHVIIPVDTKPFAPMRYYWIKYKHTDLPLYLDIFPMHVASSSINLKELVNQYIEKMNADTDHNPKSKYSKSNLEYIESSFASLYASFQDSNSENTLYARVTMVGNLEIYDKIDFDPVKKHIFDDIPLLVPANSEKLLSYWFGNYYKIPKNIISHQHNIYANIDLVKLENWIKEKQ